MSGDGKDGEWQDAYSVGHLGLDGEHRYFIALINRLSLILSTRTDPQEALELLQLLDAETAIHFQHEEDVLNLADYPGTDEHAKAHRKLMNEIQTAREAIAKLANADMSREIPRISGLRKAMIEHILSEDMAIRAYFS